MRVGDTFSGIGGFALAAGWMGWTHEWFSEVDPYASKVLAKNFPGVPNHGDITQIGIGRAVEPSPVDLICGGFPCQDISHAGKGAGITGQRSGLWKHLARLIDEQRPRWFVGENVSALRSRGLDVVLSDLCKIGYDAEWHCIPASAVGAPHQRDRIWIIAYPAGSVDGLVMGDSYRKRLHHHHLPASSTQRGGEAAPAGAVDPLHPSGGGGGGSAHVAHTHSRNGEVEWHAAGVGRWGQLGSAIPGSGPWASEPNVGRVAHGVPDRVDRLRCLGNSIVPQIAHSIFQAIAAAEGTEGA